MRTGALAKRILEQLSHDKRTLALMIIAPLLLLTLIYFIFEGTVSDIKIGTVNIPQNYEERISENDNVKLVSYKDPEKAKDDLMSGDINAYIAFPEGTEDIPVGLEATKTETSVSADVMVDGTSGSKGKNALMILETAKLNIIGELPVEYKVEYLDDIEDLTMFDEFGSTLIGFMVFFFVFLVGGMAFLKERKSGTLERLLSTPIRRREIIFGYIIGFGVVTVIQAILVGCYAVYVLDVMMKGSIWYVLLITLLSALCALTLGMLLSTTANSEFQVMQLVPVIVLPQLFFCGLFDLSAGWLAFGKIFPMYYITDALNGVMFKDEGLADIGFDIAMLLGYCVVFMAVNIMLLKKYRKV